MGWGRTLALGAVALAASPGAAFASTIAVTTTVDETTLGDGTCSLREAITAVNSPAPPTDCATAAFGPNTIVLGANRYALSIPPSGADDNATGDLNLTGTGSDVTITGAGEAATTIDASGVGDRVVHVAAGASMTLTALTITGGRAPQGLAGANGDRFQPPFTGAAGPGTAGASGGAILNDGTTELRDMAVTNSRAGSGGQGGAAQTNDLTPGTSGGAGGSGGAVFNSSSGTLTLTGVTLSGNVAGDGGAGGTVQGGSGSLCSTGGVGGAGGNGGALAGAAGAVTVAASTFSGNGAGNGGSGALGRGGCGAGGVGGVGGAGGSGGAIYQVGSMSLVNSTLVGNGAGAGGIGGGGGDHNTGPGPGGGGGGNGGVGGDAGGIEFVTGPDTVQNATVVGGSAGAGGAGGPSGVPSDPTRPSGPPGSPGAAGAAGGLLRNGAAVTLTNTIIASNAGGNCAPAGSFANGGHDFSFPDATCPGSNANPDLEALQDNGGPTQTTGLQPGSPAIDAVPAGGAGCPASDQRGVSRPQGPGCDSGAFEAAAPLNTAPPSLAGTAAVGSTITCAVGTWGNFPLSFRYAWTRDGVAIPGAASATYVVTAADAGHRLGCTVTAINGNGSISAQTTTILVPLLTPALSPLRLRPTAFSAAGRGGSIARRRRASKVTGTTIDYTDSLAARTTFTVQRPRRGFTRRGSCVVPGRRGPAKGAKRCTAWLAVGSFAHDDLAGANRLHFTGRLGKRKLAPGSYRLLAVARLGAAASAPRQAGFRIRQ